MSRNSTYNVLLPMGVCSLLVWSYFIGYMGTPNRFEIGRGLNFESGPEKEIKRSKKLPTIMAWTGYYKMNFPRFLRERFRRCPNKCNIVDKDESTAHLADVIMFSCWNPFEPPLRRSPHQLYVWFCQEAPHYPEIEQTIQKLPPDFFNLTMTYMSQSPINYQVFNVTYRKLEDPSHGWTDKKIDTLMSKKKFGSLIMVSHCDTHSKREDYVEELAKYTNITRIGACYENSTSICPKGNPTCYNNLVESHMFYLAFENSVCDGYISEKFRYTMMTSVPIVLKGDILRKQHAPEFTFIAADDFDSPRALATYLNYLQKKRDFYRNYHAWKKEFSLKNEGDSFCQLTSDLYEKKGRNVVIENIREYFMEGEGKCEQFYAQKLLRKRNSTTL